MSYNDPPRFNASYSRCVTSITTTSTPCDHRHAQQHTKHATLPDGNNYNVATAAVNRATANPRDYSVSSSSPTSSSSSPSPSSSSFPAEGKSPTYNSSNNSSSNSNDTSRRRCCSNDEEVSSLSSLSPPSLVSVTSHDSSSSSSPEELSSSSSSSCASSSSLGVEASLTQEVVSPPRQVVLGNVPKNNTKGKNTGNINHANANANANRNAYNTTHSKVQQRSYKQPQQEPQQSREPVWFARQQQQQQIHQQPQVVLALDCEMVQGRTGESLLARVVIVDYTGAVLLDSYVHQPTAEIADYRTAVSGILPQHVRTAPSLQHVRQRVCDILSVGGNGCLLVGHGLENDLRCLGIQYPWYWIRDTAYYRPFMRIATSSLDANNHNNISNKKRNGRSQQQQQQQQQHYNYQPRKLRDLVYEELNGRIIQCSHKPHCPTEDAIAALDLYKSHQQEWEWQLQQQQQLLQLQHLEAAAAAAAATTAVALRLGQLQQQQQQPIGRQLRQQQQLQFQQLQRHREQQLHAWYLQQQLQLQQPFHGHESVMMMMSPAPPPPSTLKPSVVFSSPSSRPVRHQRPYYPHYPSTLMQQQQPCLYPSAPFAAPAYRKHNHNQQHYHPHNNHNSNINTPGRMALMMAANHVPTACN